MKDPAARKRIDTLVAKATAYQDRYEFIDDLTWRDGARIAVNFTADLDAMLFRRVLDEPPCNWRGASLADGSASSA